MHPARKNAPNKLSIELSGVRKSFGSGPHSRRILEDLSATFHPGRLYVLKGKSGTGKSTLLSLIGLLDAPDSGKIRFGGQSLSEWEKGSFRAKNISFLFQDENLVEELTGEENLRIVSGDRQKGESLSRELGIASLLPKKAKELSKGEKARLSLARVLLEEKPIVLLDEPTGNLDRENTEKVYRLLGELSKRKIVIAISHDFEPEAGKGDVVVLSLKNGKLVEEAGKPVSSEKESVSFPVRQTPLRLPLWAKWRMAVSFLKRNPVRSLLSLFLSLVLSFGSALFFSLSSFDSQKGASDALSESAIPSIQVTMEKPIAGLYRRYAPTMETASGERIEDHVAYSKDGLFPFYGVSDPVKDDEILIPAFKAEKYGLSNGAILKVDGKFLTAKIVSFDSEKARLSLANRRNPDEVDSVLAASSPFVVSHRFVLENSTQNPIALANDNLRFLRTALIESGASVSDGGTLMTSENEKTGLLLPSWAGARGATEDSLTKAMQGRSFRTVPEAEGDAGFDLSRFLVSVSVSYVRFSKDPAVSLKPQLVLSKAESRLFKEQFFELGAESDLGEDGFLLSRAGFDSTDLLDLDTDYWGLLTAGDLNVLSLLRNQRPLALGLGFGFAALLLVSFYFYAFAFERHFRKERNVVVAIGYSPLTSFEIGSLPLALMGTLPALLALGVLYPSLAGALTKALSTYWMTSWSYPLVSIHWIPFAMVPLMMALSFLFLFLLERPRQGDLAEAMKQSKE